MWWQVQQVSSRLLQLHELLGSSKDIDVASMLIREPRQALGPLPPEGAAVFCICCSGCGLGSCCTPSDLDDAGTASSCAEIDGHRVNKLLFADLYMICIMSARAGC